MAGTADPARQVSYLQQCLSSDKIPVGLFLGAGCPMAIRTGDTNDSPLIPGIEGTTREVQDCLAEDEDCRALFKIVEENLRTDGINDPTVEDMLSHIRSLRAVAGRDQVRGLCGEELDKLDETICNLIHGLADKELPNKETPYHRVAVWVNAIRREYPVEVFTTNYDLLMEQAFEDCSVPYFDGFAGARKPFFDLRAMEEDKLPSRWARLWKLHGSINWYQVLRGGVFRGASKDEEGSRRVIHPSHLKYEESRRMPYLAMIDRLRAFLKQPTGALVLCGYSFRDEHLNEVIVQGLQWTQTAIAFALQFEIIDEYPQAVGLARERPNLSILARDGAVIGGQKLQWQQKDKEAVSAENDKWVMWTPIDAAVENGIRMAQFRLGDFTVFGGFLRELIGGVRQQREVADAS